MSGNLLRCTTALISWTRKQIEAKQALYLDSISYLGKQVLNLQHYTNNHNWLSKINWFNTGWLAPSWVFAQQWETNWFIGKCKNASILLCYRVVNKLADCGKVASELTPDLCYRWCWSLHLGMMSYYLQIPFYLQIFKVYCLLSRNWVWFIGGIPLLLFIPVCGSLVNSTPR